MAERQNSEIFGGESRAWLVPGGAVEPKSGAREMALNNDSIAREELKKIIYCFKRYVQKLELVHNIIEWNICCLNGVVVGHLIYKIASKTLHAVVIQFSLT